MSLEQNEFTLEWNQVHREALIQQKHNGGAERETDKWDVFMPPKPNV